MRSEWDNILSEHFDRIAVESRRGDPGLQAEHESAVPVLTQVREWLIACALPGSANPLYRVTVEDGTSLEPAWLRVRFAMRAAAVGDQAGDSTLTFSMRDDVLISVPDLSPCFRDPVGSDAPALTQAELPDVIEQSDLHAGWAVEAVQRFVRAALARQ